MDKKSKFLLVFLAFVTSITISALYYNTVLLQNFEVIEPSLDDLEDEFIE